jgi:hypothetical protein
MGGMDFIVREHDCYVDEPFEFTTADWAMM